MRTRFEWHLKRKWIRAMSGIILNEEEDPVVTERESQESTIWYLAKDEKSAAMGTEEPLEDTGACYQLED